MWASLSLSARLNAVFLLFVGAAAAANIALMLSNAGPRISAEANQSAEFAHVMLEAAYAAGARSADLIDAARALPHVQILIAPDPEQVFVRSSLPLEPQDRAVPKWFFDMVRPAAKIIRFADPDGREVVILADSRNEIREAWQDLRNFSAVSLALVAAIFFFSFRVISENRNLMGRLISVQESERRAIARELHDEIGPLLFAIRAHASTLARAPSVESILESTEAVQRLNRRMLRQLWPADLDSLGLCDALATLVASWREIAPELDIHLEMPLSAPDISSESALALYRLVQEGLTNASRHSGADRVAISIVYQSPAQLRASLVDNGRGVLAAFKPGMGLLGLGERFRLLGGTLKYGAHDLGGFEIEGRVPLN